MRPRATLSKLIPRRVAVAHRRARMRVFRLPAVWRGMRWVALSGLPRARDTGVLQLNATEIVQFLILVLIVRCRWYANAMIVATKPEAAPTAIAHLGPNTSATQPTRGAPRGVQPRKMAI